MTTTKQQREEWRLRKQQQRAREKAAQQKSTEQEQWEKNRADLEPETLAAMKAQDAHIRDLMFSMEIVVNVQELDPELIDIVKAFVEENGVVHLGYISKNDLPPDWAAPNTGETPG